MSTMRASQPATELALWAAAPIRPIQTRVRLGPWKRGRAPRLLLRAADDTIITITPRQSQILQLLAAEGLTDKEIGARLGVKPRTSRTVVCELLEAFAVDRRTALIAWLWRSGQMTLADDPIPEADDPIPAVDDQ